MANVNSTVRLINAGNQHNFHFRAETLEGGNLTGSAVAGRGQAQDPPFSTGVFKVVVRTKQRNIMTELEIGCRAGCRSADHRCTGSGQNR